MMSQGSVRSMVTFLMTYSEVAPALSTPRTKMS